MRTSRVAGLAVCLLLGVSGCAGLHHRPAATAEGPVATTAAPSAGGIRAWWSRKFHRGTAYQTTAGSAPGFAVPANAWPASAPSGGGWPAIYQFSKPPWVTRQPERAPIFSRNTTTPESQSKMTAAEANEAIARMVRARKNDDRIMPVRGDSADFQDPPTAGDSESSSALYRPIPLPGALAAEPESGPAVVVDEPHPRVPDDAPSLLLDPAVPATIRRSPIEAKREPAPAAPPERVAMTERNEEAARPDPAADEELLRSAQLPPPPPIRPLPGGGVEPEKPAAPVVPLDTPKEAPAKPADAPKPVEEPKPVEPAPAPKPAEEAPAKPAEPAPAPKPVEEPVKPVEPAVAPPPPPAVESFPVPTPPQPKAQPTIPPPPFTPALAVEDATAPSAVAQTPVAPMAQVPVAPVAQIPVAQPQTYVPTMVVAEAAPSKAKRWSFWNWKGSKGGSTYASPQSMPAHLPPATFPSSYESYWAKPLKPCPPSERFPMASPQATAHSHECEAVADKAPCWLVEKLKGKVERIKAWKEEHICRHIKDFKAALKGGKCHDCEASVKATPQAVPMPSPQVLPTSQNLPVIGGSRFGLY
ncbi:hypothetical protein [Paludisphaera rhizosphaerae]|uniref:hypothetical protein n=1 Tax=Paludisphaera rhizosphaerae TaxID=2711216 RepID=UPI0013EBE743|nr:hypothetical protein [Paludisphaera rhizosphaerae]